jgi:hypothetical protein
MCVYIIDRGIFPRPAILEPAAIPTFLYPTRVCLTIPTQGHRLTDASPAPTKLRAPTGRTRLIGRLVFCWFLKKKTSREGSLIPDEILSLATAGKTTDYYHEILEPLFFETLNKPLTQRMKVYQSSFWRQIPFLNGGLFADQGDDFYYAGEFGQSAYRNVLKVPDAWLQSLLGVFEIYNFTIDENTPVDVELSVDPEMLGRIFENLLAVINPETGETARKDTGSYYTPRPIVEYMVNESLKRYLLVNAGLKEEMADILLSYSEEPPEMRKDEREAIISALERIRVLDPACGSGAFPMGLLQKMFLVLHKLDPEIGGWVTRMLSGVPDLVRREMERSLKTESREYLYKLRLIEDSIYGVDIQPVAVEISKLRCFLSLIVDQRVDDAQDNRGVRPLPNLEFKFVCANSLIPLPKSPEADKTLTLAGFEDEDENSIKKLKELRDEYFNCYEPRKKHRLEKQFCDTQRQMEEFWLARMAPKKRGLDGRDISKSASSAALQTGALSQWQPFKNDRCPWFDPEWMFGVKDGFDVVIANPPYVFGGNAIISVRDKVAFKKLFFSGTNKINLFALFIEKGIVLMRATGTLTYIVPNTLLRVTSYDNIREYVLKGTRIKEIVDLDIGVFQNVTASTIILSLTKDASDRQHRVSIKRGISDDRRNSILQTAFENEGFIFDIFTNDQERKVIEKISANAKQLADLSIYIRFGVVITKNLAEVVGLKKLNKNWKPFLEGDEIGRYYINYKDRYLNYEKDKLHRSRTPDVFESPKIMIQRITGGIFPVKATFDQSGFYNKESIINVVLKTSDVSEYKFILALLNSSLINWFYCKKFTNMSKLTVNLSKEYLGQIPIKAVDGGIKSKIVTLVDKMLTLADGSAKGKREQYLQRIDELVYDLYGLTKAEIEIIGHMSENVY